MTKGQILHKVEENKNEIKTLKTVLKEYEVKRNLIDIDIQNLKNSVDELIKKNDSLNKAFEDADEDIIIWSR